MARLGCGQGKPVDFASLHESLKNSVEFVEYTAMRIDIEVEKGYNLSEWGCRV